MKLRNQLKLCKILIVFAFISISISPFDAKAHGHGQGEAHEHEEEEPSASVGPGKAITHATKKSGIQLSQSAVQTLGLKLQTVQTRGIHIVPKKAVARFQDEAGVFRLRDGWYKLVEITPLPQSETQCTVKTDDIQPGDQIVIEGAHLLRVAELEAWGGSGDGHGH